MTDIDVVWEADQRVVRVRLNGATTRNALNRAMLDGLAQAFSEIGATPSRRLVLVESTREDVFSTGADRHEWSAYDGIAAYRASLHGQAIFDSFSCLDVPIIAVIDGLALGGGLELALACDLRMASSRATFGLPEAKLAGGVGWGGLSRLVPLVGPARAKELLSTGRTVGAEEAMAMGLLTSVHPPDRLASAVAEMTAQILDNGRLPLPIGKQIIDALSRVPFPDYPHPLALKSPHPQPLSRRAGRGEPCRQVGCQSGTWLHANFPPLPAHGERGAGGEGVWESGGEGVRGPADKGPRKPLEKCRQ